jgi:hypothetical protein
MLFSNPIRNTPPYLGRFRLPGVVADSSAGISTETTTPCSLWDSRTRPPVLTSVSMRFAHIRDEAAEDAPTLDPLLGQVGDGVVGLGRLHLKGAMGSPSVVVSLVPGQDRPQMSLAVDEHPVGDPPSGQ